MALDGKFAESFGSVSKPCTPVVHIKIAGKWMFIPLKMVLIGIGPYPFELKLDRWLVKNWALSEIMLENIERLIGRKNASTNHFRNHL